MKKFKVKYVEGGVLSEKEVDARYFKIDGEKVTFFGENNFTYPLCVYNYFVSVEEITN